MHLHHAYGGTSLKAFISHSSVDKAVANAVYDGLETGTAWIDRAEIEWGDRFLKRIEKALDTMSDFVLLWSEAASQSAWVEFELDVAFILHLQNRAIRIRVVTLDKTPLPICLQPFHHMSTVGMADPIAEIVSALREALAEPGQGTRHRFLNRNSELERIETMINDSATKIVVLRGFMGAGKTSLAHEAFRRFFEDPSVIDILVSSGLGPMELALRLHHEAFREILSDAADRKPLDVIENAMSEVAMRGQFLLFRNAQHWLDDDGVAEEPLCTVMRVAAELQDTIRKPVMLTSTRYIQNSPELIHHTSGVSVGGLPDEHVASLISLWHELTDGAAMEHEDAIRLAPQVHGHPVAAKLAASLASRFGVDYLLDYPNELLSLRRDLAKTLIRDLKVAGSWLALMETLAIIGTPVPSAVLTKILNLSSDSFHAVVVEATGAGIANVEKPGRLVIHPLVSDYFWRNHNDREGYKERSGVASAVLHEYLNQLPNEAVGKIDVLRSVVRLYALAGMQSEAISVRRDLLGEFASVALAHYHRRQYDLAQQFAEVVLESDSTHWGMRTCLARIHIRGQRWGKADAIIQDLLGERPRNLAVLHLSGWRLLRSRDYRAALTIFTRVLARKPDRVGTLRDAAECLHRLHRSNEALEFLERAKTVETDDAYTLELESRIYEDAGEYEKALAAMRLAVIRNPGSWSLRHRLARIYHSLGNLAAAIDQANEAVILDSSQFLSLSTLASWLLDGGELVRCAEMLTKLRQLATNAHERQLVGHLEARERHLAEDYDAALRIVKQQVRDGVNLAASLGLLARVSLDQIEHLSTESPTSARVLLGQAEDAMLKCERRSDHDAKVIKNLRARIEATKVVLGTLER